MNEAMIGWLLIAVGVGLIWWGVQSIRQAKACEAWPTTAGEVTASEVVRQTDHDESRKSVKYYPHVEYVYTVDGRSYTSDCISSMDFGTTNPNGHARELTRKYRVGRRVKVYYNPEDKNTSVLQPGVSMGNYLPLVVGIGLAVAGGVMRFSG